MISALANRAVESGVDEGAGVEAVRDERMFGLALRAMGGAMEIRIAHLLEVHCWRYACAGPVNGCRICIVGSLLGVATPKVCSARRESFIGW